jgi:hypothetical protein
MKKLQEIIDLLKLTKKDIQEIKNLIIFKKSIDK